MKHLPRPLLLTLSLFLLLSCSGGQRSAPSSSPSSSAQTSEAATSTQESSSAIPTPTSIEPSSVPAPSQEIPSSEEPSSLEPASSQEPVISSEEPIVSSGESIASSEESLPSSEEETSSEEEISSEFSSEEPVVSSGESIASSEESLPSSEEETSSEEEISSEFSSEEPLPSSEPSSQEPIPSSEPSSETPVSSSEESIPSSEESEPTSSEAPSSSKSSSSRFAPPAGLGIADGAILHCFNWSLANVKNALPTIKEAGFRAIQLSPMQPQKDPYVGNWKNEWWKLYQPLGFHVAGNNENVLGTKSDLSALCKAAKESGIRVVMDVVANHLANGGSSDDPNLYHAVSQHEPYIYNHQSETLHPNSIGKADDGDLRRTVQGHIGLPDLNTANKNVQNRVISLLKEYLDCGVNGFRFDAAKHIETPEDGDCASDFWPTVLGEATTYAADRGYEAPYYYGEILYRCGGGRPFTRYTKYMSVCDNSQGSATIEAIGKKNLGGLSTSYSENLKGENLVLWGESHDTYSNDSGYESTRSYDEAQMNKAYLVQTSRKDASTLYLSRPNGNIGDTGSQAFAKPSVAAINKFHTLFAGRDEKITKSDGVFLNVRGSGSEVGAAIVGVNSGTSVSLDLGIEAGKYTDLVTGNVVNVAQGKTTITLHEDAAVLVPYGAVIDPPEGKGPSISIDTASRVFSGKATVNLSVDNAESASYSINGGTSKAFDGETSVELSSPSSSTRFTLTVKASNEYGESTKTVVLYKTTETILDGSSLILVDVPSDAALFVWAWPSGANGKWYSPSTSEGLAAFSFPDPNYLVATFEKGTTSPNWDNVKAKTSDMKLTDKIVDFDDLKF